MSLRISVIQSLVVILTSSLVSWCSADIFSATFKMEHLLETRQRVIEDLDAYIHKEEDRLRDLKLYLNLYKREQEAAMQDGSKYVGNPINAFTLIKRLTADLDDIEERINRTTEFVSRRNIEVDGNNTAIIYPTDDDLEGAAVAMRRLQKTYKLKVEDLARGVLDGTIYRSPMFASDCMKLGSIMLRKKQYRNLLAWAMEALHKFRLEENVPFPLNVTYIMEHIAISHYRMNDPWTAAEWMYKVLQLDPTSNRARGNFITFDQIIAECEGNYTPKKPESEDVKQGAGNATDIKNIQDTINKGDIVPNNTTEQKTDLTNGTTTENKDDIVRTEETVTVRVNIGSETMLIKVKDSDAKINKDTAKLDTTIKIYETDNNRVTTAGNITEKLDIEVKNDTISSEIESETDAEMEKLIEDFSVAHRSNLMMYEALCRGEYELAPELSSRLSCRYVNDKPFLKLAPIKMEQLYINPDAFLFYDVISDGEIEHVKEISAPDLQRARVGGAASRNESKPANYRISQSTWVPDNRSTVFTRLTQRISDYTGLNVTSAEFLQVANYGIGGQYEPHVDWIGEQPLKANFGEERIATSMFYMSDVAQGGATVFPKLGLSVFPVKGAAIFWYNLLPSGEGNLNTLHAACPVLEGSKWVANKWIYMKEQEHSRPCNLEHQQTVKVEKPIKPILKSSVKS